MTDLGVLNKLYSKSKTEIEFNFERLWAPSIYNFLTMQDIVSLNNIATSTRLSAKINLKYDLINQIMSNRGFKKFAAGTNRVVYSYLEDDTFVVKIAIDKVGLKDNPAEFYNQASLQPFVTKCFEVTPCGTVGVFERVLPIINKREFASIAEDVFDIITLKLIGKYVVDDMGSKYFMNWGVRKGVCPCLLDYPYVFELDSDKLYCNQFDKLTGTFCGGVIDYDDGFNDLICTKCGRKYVARDLEKAKKDNLIITGGNDTMKVKIVKGDVVIANSEKSADYIEIPKAVEEEKKDNELKVSIKIATVDEINKNKTKISMEAMEEMLEDKKTDGIPVVLTEDTSEIEEAEVPENTEENESKDTDKENFIKINSKFIPSAEDNKEEETKYKQQELPLDITEDEPVKPKRDSKGRFVKRDQFGDEVDDYNDKDKKHKQQRRNERRNKNLDKF